MLPTSRAMLFLLATLIKYIAGLKNPLPYLLLLIGYPQLLYYMYQQEQKVCMKPLQVGTTSLKASSKKKMHPKDIFYQCRHGEKEPYCIGISLFVVIHFPI